MNFEFNKKLVFGLFNTEKSVYLKDNNRVIVLWVAKNSTKEVIKKEIEKVLNVVVDSVNVVRFTKLGRMFKGKRGSEMKVKKAYVKISSESNFDFSKLQ